MNKGFTLFMAIVVTGTLLVVATGLVNVALKQSLTTSSARESQYAYYAADSGIECALYWDVKNPSGNSAFATSSASNISCNNSPATSVGGGGANGTSTFSYNLTPYCVSVTVNKKYVDTNSDGILDRFVTTIESKGYNTCVALNPRRVERAVRLTY